MGNSVFICDSNIVETPFASDNGNNTRPLPNNPIAHNAFDTRYITLVVASFDTPSVSPITKQWENGPCIAVGSVSGNRGESDCRSRGREFDPGSVPYFRGD